jgi:hypothetical protein
MSDEHDDRMVRDADPYRPAAGGRLDGAKHTLLEEIMSEPGLDHVGAAPRWRGSLRRPAVRRFAGALAAAAAVTGVLVAPALLRDQPDDRRSAGPTESAGPTGSATPAGAPLFPPPAVQGAEDNPRLLIDEPGWKATTVYGFAEESGTIAFDKGGRQLEMTWYPADQYDRYHKDRLDVSAPEAVEVDGRPGDLFTYSADDFAVMLRPRDGAFVEFRTGGGWPRAEFDRVLARVVHVDVRTWLAALPPEIVTPDRVDQEAAKVLADVPLPPGFDPADLGDLGTNDAYQFGAQVTGRVGCAWIAEWERAKLAGDDAALRRAADALRSSHNWKVLHRMDDEGAWPEVFWDIADRVAAGNPPAGYAQGIGCA